MRAALNLLLVILLALNLRPILTSIGPLLEPMRASTGLGYQQAALLTALHHRRYRSPRPRPVTIR